MAHQQDAMNSNIAQLEAKLQQLRMEDLQLRMQAQSTTHPQQLRMLLQRSELKDREVVKLDSELQMMKLKSFEQKFAGHYAISQLRNFNQRGRISVENKVRVGMSWGAALGAYFLLGTSFFQSILVFLSVSFSARFAFAILRRAGG